MPVETLLLNLEYVYGQTSATTGNAIKSYYLADPLAAITKYEVVTSTYGSASHLTGRSNLDPEPYHRMQQGGSAPLTTISLLTRSFSFSRRRDKRINSYTNSCSLKIRLRYNDFEVDTLIEGVKVGIHIPVPFI